MRLHNSAYRLSTGEADLVKYRFCLTAGLIFLLWGLVNLEVLFLVRNIEVRHLLTSTDLLAKLSLELEGKTFCQNLEENERDAGRMEVLLRKQNKEFYKHSRVCSHGQTLLTLSGYVLAMEFEGVF